MKVPYQMCMLGIALAIQSILPTMAAENRVTALPPGKSPHPLTLHNRTAYISSQCYTKTRDEQGKVHNPCFSCHTRSKRPNFVHDLDFQISYTFSEDARTNPWTNLFVDRREAVAAISDQEIKDYIGKSNYFDAQGRIILASALSHPAKAWEHDGNGRWDGYVPDAWFQFDPEGFDRDPNGKLTGWRAFAYYPFLGTFWPTNGATDDVLIRLSKPFQNGPDGNFNLQVYKTNLAIVEAMLKEEDVPIEPTDERAMGGVDLDKDGHISTARLIKYDWAPLEKREMWYVGQAYQIQKAGKLQIAAGLYPKGTEFLHSVRYIAVDEKGNNHLTPRMKELRYAKKQRWLNYSQLKDLADAEFKEKHDFPNRLRTFLGNREKGILNGQGWVYSGFIEDADGALRPQNWEELVYCAGCHGGIGATRDGIFSFHRKFDARQAFQNGWYHWSQKGLAGTPDRLRSDGRHEFAHYLEQNQSGNEFRTNEEIMANFFNANGQLKPEKMAALKNDLSTLLFASANRASMLNKTYRAIVIEQSFVKGRDATLVPVATVYQQVDEDKTTGISAPVLGY